MCLLIYDICFLVLTYFTLYDGLWVHPHLYKWPSFVPFYDWVIFHCVCVPHLLYPLLCGWTFRLLPGMKTLSHWVLGVMCYMVIASWWGFHNCFLILVFVSSGAHPGPFNVLRTELPSQWTLAFSLCFGGFTFLFWACFCPTPTISANLTRILRGNELCHRRKSSWK